MASYHPSAFAEGHSFSTSAQPSFSSSSTSRYVVRETPFAPYFDNSFKGEGGGVLKSWADGAGGGGGSTAEDGKHGGGGGRAHLEAQASSSSDEEEDEEEEDRPPPRPLTPRPFQPRATGGFFPPTVRTFPSGRRRAAVSSNAAVGHSSSSSSSSSLPFTDRHTAPHTFNLDFSAPPIGIIDSGHSTAYSFPNETPSSPTSAARPRTPTSSGSSESPPPVKKARTSKAVKGNGKKVAVEEEEEEDSGMEDKEFTSHDPPGYSWGIPRSEYLALSAEKKKQLRNRVGAKIFRERRKKYLSELEGKIEQRDEKISKLEDQVAALTRELEKRDSRS